MAAKAKNFVEFNIEDPTFVREIVTLLEDYDSLLDLPRYPSEDP
jgi:hypothetical protein